MRRIHRKEVRAELPGEFLSHMAALLDDEYPAFFASLHESPHSGLRVNTLKLSAEEFKKISPFDLVPIPWCANGFIIHESGQKLGQYSPGKHPYHGAGIYYLQEPSAMAVAEVLGPQPGMKVLDLAAAPGGKATHLASLMQNAGILMANEIHPSRVRDLAENLERCGVTNAFVTNETPEHLADRLGEFFDCVLLDAPCSGEGMFRKSHQARVEWKPDSPASCAIRQRVILEQAARLVKVGGSLAYTTCTFSPEENEAVICDFLTAHGDFEIKAIQPAAGLQPARPDWIGLPKEDALSQAVRIWPHLSKAEGHFIALLFKHSSTGANDQPASQKYDHSNRYKGSTSEDVRLARRIWTDFAALNLRSSLKEQDVTVVGSRIYLLSQGMPNLAGLKVIHPGWYLGRVHNQRFIPSHALALGIPPRHAASNIPLGAGDPSLRAYLAGECFQQAGDDGWVLISVDGFSIGWGKRVQGVVKNFYPRGLRRVR
ncbi:MAG: RsmB/NOP family class I SAM-dependent RNA methyltransferase [Acidobacteriaceae bacterium]